MTSDFPRIESQGLVTEAVVILEDAWGEACPTSEGKLYRKVLASALVDMAKGRSSRDRLTAEAFFFEPDARCDNHPRADPWCWGLGLDPDFVRKIARKIADRKIDVLRRVEEYRSQGDRCHQNWQT